MRCVAVAVLLLAFRASVTQGHDWLVEPPSRSGEFSSTLDSNIVCDRPADAAKYKMSVVVSGALLRTQWRGLHVPDSNRVQFALIPASVEGNSNPDLYVINETSYNAVAYDLLIPRAVKSGRYTLRWTWANFQSCTDLWIIDRTAGSYLGKTGGIGASVGPTGKAETRSSIPYDAGGWIALAVIVGLLLLTAGAAYTFLKLKKPEKLEEFRSKFRG